jgi:MoxR-like ATPase
LASDNRDFDEFLDKFKRHRELMTDELHNVIVGQDAVIEQILSAIFTGGHCLLVGVPGLAKTLVVSTIARILDSHPT